LGICSQGFYRVFAYVVIHTNSHTGLKLKFGAIQSAGTI
jgi:hypothetical protein